MGGSVTCVKVAGPRQWSILVSCYSGLFLLPGFLSLLGTVSRCCYQLVLCLKCSHSFQKEILLLEITMFVSSLTL